MPSLSAVTKSVNQLFYDLPASWFFASGLLLGIQLALSLSVWPAPEILVLLFLLAMGAILRGYWGRAGLLLGYFWLLVFLAWRMELAPSWLDTQGEVTLVADILESRPSSKGPDSLVLQVKQCTRAKGEPCTLAARAPARIRLNWYSPETLPQAGETWQLEARIRPLHSLKNFDAPSFTASQLAQGLVSRGYIGRSAETRKLTAARGLDQLRSNWLQHLNQADMSETGRRFFMALALGERQALLPEDWEILERTGTIHLWVISGLHLGMLAGLVLWLARPLRLPWIPALLLSLAVAWSYAQLSGWGVAAQRAAIMLGLTALLLSGWRRLSPWTIFSLALSLVLLLNPLLVLGRGLWLSFGAVALLLLALRGLKPVGAWRNLLRVQWVIALGLTPLLLWQNAHFSLWAPLVNLMAVPLVGLLLLPLSFFSLVVLALTGGTWPAEITAWMLGKAVELLSLVAAWPSWEIQHPAWLWLGLLGLMPPGFPGRLLAPLGLILAFLPQPAPEPDPLDKDWQVKVLDVGQGTAILVENQGQKLLYDTGSGYPSGWAPAIAALQPQMRGSNFQHLVISHEDNDHSGGLPKLLDKWSAEEVWMPRPYGNLCHAGQSWQLGALDILALWPPKPVEERVNNEDSCVLLIRGEEHSLLLTGDATTDEEAFFSQALPSLLKHQPLTLLISGHHGSQTSTGTPLLEATQPRLAIHTAGWRNHHGHPHISVVQRLLDFQSRQLNTGHHGAIFINLQPGKKPQIQTWSQQNQPLWEGISHKPN
ncbi:ComEC/Rec2 family competence protein [Marinospirillum sp.]|uniref:ComEC/Rec2 family competence protein n=1 Tax=Marinospirillum sp. TaxID=2183934 RepID=UPI0028707618|nr:ComEC/Rec2 family competence protein [Marinospirillum sp.]MDR9468394.1 ComEC/Rec2 family competence protein [Marinospirillum sp.]